MVYRTAFISFIPMGDWSASGKHAFHGGTAATVIAVEINRGFVYKGQPEVRIGRSVG